MIPTLSEIEDSFDDVAESWREEIKELVAVFHYRDGKEHPDGSLGSIKISPKQLRDVIAHALYWIP